jgi:TPP-dependent pyruvate/acetoin dehydrogenase alpha subunit
MIWSVRSGRPACLVLNTQRLAPHSKGDDDRPVQELEHARAADPLNRLLHTAPPALVAAAERNARTTLHACLDQVLQADVLSYSDFAERTIPRQ